jgi:hypothetical protein
MSIRPTVFGSPDERRVYYKLVERWGNRLHVWHNLPFAQIISIEDDDEYMASLGSGAKEFLYKTSVDYTFCLPDDDRPILAIEFDGRSKGHSAGDAYYQRRLDEVRHLKNTSKLKVASHNDFPFFILQYDEVRDITPAVKIAIVDGLVGDVLVFREMQEKWYRREYQKEGTFGDYMSMSFADRKLCERLWYASTEYDFELQLNPICQHLNQTGMPYYPDIRFVEVNDGLLECVCTLYYWDRSTLPVKGEVALRTSIRMPDFDYYGCGSRLLAERIAMAVAFDESARKGIVPREVPPVLLILRIGQDKSSPSSVVIRNCAYVGPIPAGCDPFEQAGGYLIGEGSGDAQRSQLAAGTTRLVSGLWFIVDGDGKFVGMSGPSWV